MNICSFVFSDKATTNSIINQIYIFNNNIESLYMSTSMLNYLTHRL